MKKRIDVLEELLAIAQGGDRHSPDDLVPEIIDEIQYLRSANDKLAHKCDDILGQSDGLVIELRRVKHLLKVLLDEQELVIQSLHDTIASLMKQTSPGQ